MNESELAILRAVLRLVGGWPPVATLTELADARGVDVYELIADEAGCSPERVAELLAGLE